MDSGHLLHLHPATDLGARLAMDTSIDLVSAPRRQSPTYSVGFSRFFWHMVERYWRQRSPDSFTGRCSRLV